MPTGWPNRSNGWRTMPCGARCGTRPCLLPPGGGQGGGTLGLSGGGGRVSSRRWRPWRISRRVGRRYEQAIDLRFGLRHALSAREDRPHPRASARRRRGSPGPRRSPPAGLGAGLNDQLFWTTGDSHRAIEVGQRTLALASTLGDAALQVVLHLFLGRSTTPWVTTPGHRPPAAERGVPRRGAAPGALRPAVAASVGVWYPVGPVSRRVGRVRRRAGPRRRRPPDCRGCRSPHEHDRCCYGLGHAYLRKGDFHQAILWLERGLAVGRAWDIPRLFTSRSCGPGRCVCPGWTGGRRPAAAGAGCRDGGMAMMRRRVLSSG